MKKMQKNFFFFKISERITGWYLLTTDPPFLSLSLSLSLSLPLPPPPTSQKLQVDFKDS